MSHREPPACAIPSHSLSLSHRRGDLAEDARRRHRHTFNGASSSSSSSSSANVASLLGHDQLGLMALAGRVAHADDELVLQLKPRDGSARLNSKAMADTPEAER